MTDSRAHLRGIVVFAVCALIGPSLRLMNWPPSLPSSDSTEVGGDFLYDLILLLWPAQPLATIEANVGTSAGTLIAVIANITLFIIVGLIAGILAKYRLALFTLYACLVGLLIFLSLPESGSSISYTNFSALIVAIIIYTIPFVVINYSDIKYRHKKDLNQ